MSRRDRRKAKLTVVPKEPEPSGYVTRIDDKGKPQLLAYWENGVIPPEKSTANPEGYRPRHVADLDGFIAAAAREVAAHG